MQIRAWLVSLEQMLGALLGGQAPDGSTPFGQEPTLAQLVGQKLMVRMAGHRPSRALLGRIEPG